MELSALEQALQKNPKDYAEEHWNKSRKALIWVLLIENKSEKRGSSEKIAETTLLTYKHCKNIVKTLHCINIIKIKLLLTSLLWDIFNRKLTNFMSNYGQYAAITKSNKTII